MMRSLALVLLVALPVAAGEPKRTATAGAERHPLLELYTSEGCSSCPPADAWLSQAGSRLVALGFVPLAFHVDYWDELGWPDPFAQQRFTMRQQWLAQRDGGHLYTPEFALDGHELPRGELNARLQQSPRAGKAKLTLEVTGTASLHIVARASDASVPVRVFAAVFENGLTVDVARGENAGKTLRHDFVVRALTSAEGSRLERDLAPPPEWGKLGVAAFVEDARTGEVLQAVALQP